MICQLCGGCVIWCGPWRKLSHTVCEACGALNSQQVEENEEAEDE